MDKKDFSKLYALDVYIGLRIINNYHKFFGHMHQNYIPIIDLSFQNSNIREILYALDSLDRLGVFDTARLGIPSEGFSKELKERIDIPSSYHFTWHGDYKESAWDLDYTAHMFNQEPNAIDKGRCGFWSNNRKLKELQETLREHIKAYTTGNLPPEYRSSKLSYSKQKEQILKFLEEEYKNNCDINDPMIYIELSDSRLQKLDVIRTLAALSFEETGNILKSEQGYEYPERLIYLSDIINKRQKWVEGIDDITIYVRLSNSLVNHFEHVQKKQTRRNNNQSYKSTESLVAGNFTCENGEFSYKDDLIVGDDFLLAILFELMKVRSNKISLQELHQILSNSKKGTFKSFTKYPSLLNKLINESIESDDKTKKLKKFVYVKDKMCILNVNL